MTEEETECRRQDQLSGDAHHGGDQLFSASELSPARLWLRVILKKQQI